MVDVVNPEVRSRMMASIRSRDTRPEMVVRQFLHAQGFRYKLHDRSLPGSPDLVLPKFRLAVFVHGCFFHRHANCRFATWPEQNRDKWRQKFEQNVQRDARNAEQLRERGWRVIIIWECGLRTAEHRSKLEFLPGIVRNTEISLFEWPPPTTKCENIEL